MKKFLSAARQVGGFLVGAVTIFAWLNVTPQSVGEVTYTAIFFASPVILFASGAIAGWGLTKQWADRKLAERNARIAELEKRPTMEEVEGAIARERVETTRFYLGDGFVSDERVRLSIEKGSIAGFDREVMERVLSLGAVARGWLRRASESGYVDVREAELEFHDRQGRFRELADEEDCHAGRYVLRRGVRDVLERYPEVFDAVDDYDRQVRAAIEAARRAEPRDIKYRKVSRDE